VVIFHSSSYAGPFNAVDTVYTNTLGYYRYDGGIDPGEGSLASILIKSQAFKKGYYDNKDHSIYYTSAFQTTWNTEMSPYAWCTVHIKNVRPVDENDVLKTLSVDSRELYYGTKIDTMITFRRPVNEWWPLYYSYIKGGVVSPVFLDSIYMVGHDTISAKIFY
jgi:hypothetical protein